MSAILASLLILTTQPVAATDGFEKIYEMKVADFEEFKVVDDRFQINNFILRESPDGRRGQSVIKFGANVRNKAKGYENFSIMLVGMDDKKTPLWVSKAVSSVDGNWLGTIQDYETSVPKGTLKSTPIVWMKVTVSANSDED